MVESRKLFPQKALPWMFDRVLDKSLTSGKDSYFFTKNMLIIKSIETVVKENHNNRYSEPATRGVLLSCS